jgi:hypothetical protein
VTLQDVNRFGVGLSAGAGYSIGIDGVARPSAYVGLGFNFNLWEP